jgi:hypothetical protein
MARSLPVLQSPFSLDEVQVASPCHADWNDMTGDERVRFCGSCAKNVYNLSGMTRREATDLLVRTEGRVCVRFFRREDGTMLTADCPVGVRAALRRARREVLLAAAASFAAVTALVAFLGGSFAKKTCERLDTTRQQILEQVEPPRDVPADPREALMGVAPPPRPVMGEAPAMPPPAMGAPAPPREVKGDALVPVRPLMGKVAPATKR